MVVAGALIRTVAASQLPFGPRTKCTTGCPELDLLLGGGVPVGSVTELVGEATAGKTQLCLQLLLTAQRPVETGGLGGRSMCIFTEGRPPVRRLKQLELCHQQLLQGSRSGFQGPLPLPSTDGILLAEGVQSLGDLRACLRRLLAALPREEPPVRLLVVDSIANVARDHNPSTTADGSSGAAGSLRARSEELFGVSALLRKIAGKHGVAVVVTNQVTDHFEDHDGGGRGMEGLREEGEDPNVLTTSGRRVVPSLGLAMSNCVNTRLFLSRSPGSPTRTLRVVFSPSLPMSSCHYTIAAAGPRGVPGTWQPLNCCSDNKARDQSRPTRPGFVSSSASRHNDEAEQGRR